MLRTKFRMQLLAGIAACVPAGAWAQVATPPSDPAVAPPPAATPAGKKAVYTPADFARFAPRTAYDMLVQVPGFTIRGASAERGLGQASENVLVNGQRIANKSGGAIDELQKLSASRVERIEIVEAASLGIAGLSGAVANVIVKEAKASSGQFEWRPDFRAHFSKPNLFRGSISYNGEMGPVDYTLSVRNQAGRGAFGGAIYVSDADGEVFEVRDEVFHAESDLVTFSTKFALDGPGSSLGNLTLAYTPYWAPSFRQENRARLDGDDRVRTVRQTLKGWYYDVNADFAFALGPGRLKLIGVRHWDKEPITTTQLTEFESGAPDEGVRFVRDSRIAETIGRAEYAWKTGANDWQATFERAHNSLDQRGGLFVLSPDGEFEEVDFPQGSGQVSETRYEGIVTFTRALSPTLDLQVAGGAEVSRLGREDSDIPPRNFFRPKGSVNFGWRPGEGWEASLKLRRKVGQISFYDFLAQPRLAEERENAGNPDLVPPQSWEVEGEVARDFGTWGKTRMKVYYHRVEDIVDVIPIGDSGVGIGNLPKATRVGMENTSTLLFDNLGFKGAKLDLRAGYIYTAVKDPLTGVTRPISGTRDRWVGADFRHDIPGSDLAWGLSASHDHFRKYYYLTEVFRSWEGPVWLSAYVEHKDVMGLTVRAQVGNLLNARHRFRRFVYEGRRDQAPLDFVQDHNQLIGPIFNFSVRGNF